MKTLRRQLLLTSCTILFCFIAGAAEPPPDAKALLLWLRSFLDTERHTRGFPRSFVSYEMLLSDWRAVMIKVGADPGITWPGPQQDTPPATEGCLSVRRRHR